MWHCYFFFSSHVLQKSGVTSQPDQINGTSSLRDPSLKDAPKPGPSAGASSVPPIPQDNPSSVPYPGHHPSHTSVPPLVPPYPPMSSPSVPGQAQARGAAGQPLKSAEGGLTDTSKLTCHQCSKGFNVKPLLLSNQVSSTVYVYILTYNHESPSVCMSVPRTAREPVIRLSCVASDLRMCTVDTHTHPHTPRP